MSKGVIQYFKERNYESQIKEVKRYASNILMGAVCWKLWRTGY
jgi:hypothetical protein